MGLNLSLDLLFSRFDNGLPLAGSSFSLGFLFLFGFYNFFLLHLLFFVFDISNCITCHDRIYFIQAIDVPVRAVPPGQSIFKILNFPIFFRYCVVHMMVVSLEFFNLFSKIFGVALASGKFGSQFTNNLGFLFRRFCFLPLSLKLVNFLFVFLEFSL